MERRRGRVDGETEKRERVSLEREGGGERGRSSSIRQRKEGGRSFNQPARV